MEASAGSQVEVGVVSARQGGGKPRKLISRVIHRERFSLLNSKSGVGLINISAQSDNTDNVDAFLILVLATGNPRRPFPVGKILDDFLAFAVSSSHSGAAALQGYRYFIRVNAAPRPPP